MCHLSVFQFLSHGHNETCRTFRRSVYLFTHIAFSAAVTESDQRILQFQIDFIALLQCQIVPVCS